MQRDPNLTSRRLTIGLLALALVSFSAPLASPLAVETAPQHDTQATKAGIAAAQILYDKAEYQAARDLLTSYLADSKAVLIYVRSGLALGIAGEDDFRLIVDLSNAGNPTAARIAGDMLRNGTGTSPDLAAAETLYRRAVALGDRTSKSRLAGLLAQQERFPEAISAYAELIDNPADEVKYVVLSITKGDERDPAKRTALVERLEVLAQTQPAAARAAASIYESGEGVPQDAVKAVVFARRAVALGDTELGLKVAQQCETCSAVELVEMLKATTSLESAEETGRALEKPLARGLYEDAWGIILRFQPSGRTAIVRHVLDRFGAVSNPVVGLTQALMRSRDAYDGKLDGMLSSTTIAAVQRFAAARNMALVQFDDALVTALFADTE